MSASDPDGSISAWVLRPGDGSPDYSGSGNPPATKSHTYSTPGSYTAILMVSDNKDATASDSQIINVSPPNQPPTANAHGPYSGNINESIQFYGSGTDPDGDAITAYAWDFNGDNVTDSALQNPTHSWSSAGTCYPTLKVQDATGMRSLPDKCMVLIATPLSYGGALTGVYPQPHCWIGETARIDIDVKNTGGTAETYDLRLVVYDKDEATVYDDTITSIYLSPNGKTTDKFYLTPLPVGDYSFIVSLNSSSSGKVYDSYEGTFAVLISDSLLVIENDAEPLKKAALDELDEMVNATSEVSYNTVIELTWGYIKDVIMGKLVGMFDSQVQLFTGMSQQDLVEAALEADETFYDFEKAIAKYGEGTDLKSGLKEVFRNSYTLPAEGNVINRDEAFDNFVLGKQFQRDENLIQVFRTGEATIENTMESGQLQKEKDMYEDLQRVQGSWSFHLIEFIAALALLAAVIFTIVSVVGAALVTLSIAILKSFLGALSILPKLALLAIAIAMVVSLPSAASEVTTRHNATLDIAETMISQQTTSTADVFSIAAEPQTSLDKQTKFSITVGKEASKASEPIIDVIVSPDGRVIDMSLYQTKSSSGYETLSSSIKLPHQPGKYKILAMTTGDIEKSSVKQTETTQTAPNVSVSISTDKPFYNFMETVTATANFTNTAPEKVENLTFSIDVLGTSYNKTGFLEIDANSSRTEMLSFVPVNNGTYKVAVTLFAGLYIMDSAETGFTVEAGRGVSVNVDCKEVYDPNINVTANLTINNIGTESYQGSMSITTVDTLNNYQGVHNSTEQLSINKSEERELQCTILPRESATPGIYRSYMEIENSTYIFGFTVAANNTIFISARTDKLIYSESESVMVNISVKDVAFNATNATINLTSTDPSGNKTYFDATGSNGNYSALIPPNNKSVNGTYTILANGTKEGCRVYSDQTFFIVNERTKLRCDMPGVIQLNTTDTINLFVKSDTDRAVKDAFVRLTGCGFNETRTTDENGLVVFDTSSMNQTGIVHVSIEKGGYGSLMGNIRVTLVGATLEGHVSFPGRGTPPDDRWIESFNVTLFESGNLSHVLWTTNATTNNTGVFTITGLTPGAYDVGIKNWTCLSELVANVTLSSGVTTVVNFGTTREGDSNNDDWITGADRSILYTDWGKTVPPGTANADFDRDGWLTGADRSFMYTNWSQHGDLI